MKFKKGDKVRFLNDIGSGVVVESLDAQTYLVRNADGFEIPTMARELLLDVPLEQALAGAAQQPRAPEPAPATPVQVEKQRVQIPLLGCPRGGVGLHVAFQAADENDPAKGPYKMHIINASGYSCYATMACMQGSLAKTFFAGKVAANAARQVKELEAHELEEYRRLLLQVIYYSDAPCELPQPESVELSVNPVRFSRPGSFQENQYLPCSLLLISVRDTQREALLHSLVSERAAQANKDNVAAATPKPSKRPMRQEEVVVDLHMHALTDSEDPGVSPRDILTYQISRFERTMDDALANPAVRRVVAVHGVGNGRLRSEVIRVLRSKYPMCGYQDASFKEYGYGATMVLLHRKH